MTADARASELLDIIAAARKGDAVADRSLRNAALELLSARKPLPDPLTAYVMEIIAGFRSNDPEAA
jgi:hypothetical protein